MVGQRGVAFGGLGLVEGGIGLMDHRVGAGGGEPDAGADRDGERAAERDGRFDRGDDSPRQLGCPVGWRLVGEDNGELVAAVADHEAGIPPKCGGIPYEEW
jgi:hypothetical protein